MSLTYNLVILLVTNFQPSHSTLCTDPNQSLEQIYSSFKVLQAFKHGNYLFLRGELYIHENVMEKSTVVRILYYDSPNPARKHSDYPFYEANIAYDILERVIAMRQMQYNINYTFSAHSSVELIAAQRTSELVFVVYDVSPSHVG